MAKSTSREEDDRRFKGTRGRVDTSHGGEIVEAVSPEELHSFNDADCKHEKVIPDPTEVDFDAYLCANEKCSVVLLYDKQ